MSKEFTNEEVIAAFHMMWGNFPEVVMLTQKNREILALNKKAEAAGMQTGIKCSSMGSAENHRGCLCNQAVNDAEATYVTYDSPFGKAFGYWIPVAGREDLIVHLGVGYAFDYPQKA